MWHFPTTTETAQQDWSFIPPTSAISPPDSRRGILGATKQQISLSVVLQERDWTSMAFQYQWFLNEAKVTT